MKKTILSIVIISVSCWCGFTNDNDMVSTAGYFMKAFGKEIQSRLVYDMNDAERTNWHYIPKQRNGIAFGEMDSAQQKLAHALIVTALSHEGYEKAMEIMYLEKVLHDTEGADIRNPNSYNMTLFGKPGDTGEWGWRLEGHHISLNFTLIDGKVVSFSPFFLGANPAEVKQGSLKGLRVLKKEEDVARRLVDSLSEDQRKIAVLSVTAPAEIITHAQPVVEHITPEGIQLSQLKTDQKPLLIELLHEYAYRLRPTLADSEMEKIKQAAPDAIYFVWIGGIHPGEGHYYRVQGPSFILEYDNTQNNANHIHTVWRDPKNDFGRDVLREHYQQSHRQ